MASGDQANWPGPVTFDDNVPKDGYCTIHLKIPGLKVTGGMFGGAKPKNASFEFNITAEKVDLRVKKQDSSDEYCYCKQLPEDIDKTKSELKFKDERIQIKLCKVKSTSWGAHASYLIMKE